MKKNDTKKLLKTTLVMSVILAIFSTTFVPVTRALTQEEIEAQLEQKRLEADKLSKELKGIESELAQSKGLKNKSINSLSDVKDQISYVENQLKYLELKSEQTESTIDLKELEIEQQQEIEAVYLADMYIEWKSNSSQARNLLLSGSTQNIIKTAAYNDVLADDAQKDLVVATHDLASLRDRKEILELEKKEMASESELLLSQKKILEDQLAEANKVIAGINSNADGVRAKLKNTTQDIEFLTDEQERIIEQEQQQTGGGNNDGGTIPIITGQIYFEGRGRDSGQGHGVGMSQWGAFGYARAGYNYQQILTNYYAQTRIEARTGINITLTTGAVLSADDYVSGLGEVPSKACGTLEQITAWAQFADSQGWGASDPRRSKYIIDNTSTVWDCWPEEAIKAQVVAARSYAASNNGPICTTAACQVYAGGTAKAWAAYETTNQYVVSSGSTHNNKIIRALYSADNNQGYGTANNDTVFSSYEGNGTPYSYLRAFNDSPHAYPGPYTSWTWRTNSYSAAQIDQMLAYAAANYESAGVRAYVASLKSTIGTLQNIELEKDGSNRNRKIKLTGTQGSKYIAGWLFKAIWNDWIHDVRPSGQTDYIYSLTFWRRGG